MCALLLLACPFILGSLAIVPNNPDYLGFLATSFEDQYKFNKPGLLFPFPGCIESVSLESRVLMTSFSLYSFLHKSDPLFLSSKVRKKPDSLSR